MNYIIREMKEAEYPLLNDFLYKAIFIPEGAEPPRRSIIDTPELQVYVSGFGTREHDRAFIAEIDGTAVGAVWVRVMKDYGHIGDSTPSFAVSLYQAYRGLGIGTAMMKKMLSSLKESGYRQASLSVQKSNYAAAMYRKLGFEIVGENEEEFIMIFQLERKKGQGEQL